MKNYLQRFLEHTTVGVWRINWLLSWRSIPRMNVFYWCSISTSADVSATELSSVLESFARMDVSDTVEATFSEASADHVSDTVEATFSEASADDVDINNSLLHSVEFVISFFSSSESVRSGSVEMRGGAIA